MHNQLSRFVRLTIILVGALLIVLLYGTPPRAAHANGRAVVLSEGFDDITTLAAAGWVQQNNSAPPGLTG